MIPKDVSVSTLAGPASAVGDRIGWTLEELVEAYSAMPSGAKLLRYETTRWDIYTHLVAPALDQYIDWETGDCSFDNREFQDTLGFLSLFPNEVDTWLKSYELEMENYYQKKDGYQMLEPATVHGLLGIMGLHTEFGEPVSLVGYPTADGSPGSSFIFHGRPLAMSAYCKDKEAAWDFIRRYFLPVSKSVSGIQQAHIRIPLNQIAYRLLVIADQSRDGTFFQQFYTNGPLELLHKPGEKEARDFCELVENTTLLYWPDNLLSDAVWDAIAPYFSGDRTMEETIDLVQRRVRLYVNEQR